MDQSQSYVVNVIVFCDSRHQEVGNLKVIEVDFVRG